jgi:hypothetical protein
MHASHETISHGYYKKTSSKCCIDSLRLLLLSECGSDCTKARVMVNEGERAVPRQNAFMTLEPAQYSEE